MVSILGTIIAINYKKLKIMNQAAHALARAARSQSGPFIWFSSFPLVLNALFNDILVIGFSKKN